MPGAEIYFKTDDNTLYIESLRYFEMCGFKLMWQTDDLHNNEPDWNIRTEHENMFSGEGITIKACITRMISAELDKATLSVSREL